MVGGTILETRRPMDTIVYVGRQVEKDLTILDIWNCDRTLCNVGRQNNLWNIKEKRLTFPFHSGYYYAEFKKELA
jgi:hypothetical protein